MKICFISASVGTISASQETVIYQMAKNLNKKHDVTLITGRSRIKHLLKPIETAPFEIVTVPFWPRNTPLNDFFSQFFGRLFGRLNKWKVESLSFYISVMLRPNVKRKIKEADVIVSYYRTDNRLFSNLAYRYRVPTVSNLQFVSVGKGFFDIDKSIIYITNSKYSKYSFERKYGVKIDGVVTPGISLEFFNEDVPTIPDIRRQKTLLFVGFLRREKGIFELIEIFNKIYEKHKDIMLVIVGVDGEKEALIDRLRSLKLSDRVIFVGEIDYEDMPSYYRSATLLIHPTYRETFGMVVLEAMASGLPVIASDIPALREVTGGRAILLPLNNLNLWIEKIDYLLKNEKNRKEISMKGIEKAKEELWEKKAEQLEQYLIKAAKYKGKL
ncbi:MAG: glycosyltransferase family 4 protein [Candidatus Hodarchaeota archaeon]